MLRTKIFGIMLLTSWISAESLKVLKSTGFVNSDRGKSWAKLANPPPANISLSKGITFCARFHFENLVYSRVFSVYRGIWEFKVEVGYYESYVGFGAPTLDHAYNSWVLKLGKKRFFLWTPVGWHNICFAFDKSRNHVLFVKDGEVTNLNHVDEKLSNLELTTDFIQDLYVSYCPLDNLCGTHHGAISDVQVWSYPLSLDQALSWTNCSTPQNGDLVSWNTADWTSENIYEYSMDMYQMCHGVELGTVIIPGRFNMTTIKWLWKSLRGKVAVIDSQESQDYIMDVYDNGHERCHFHGRLYTGWWDTYNEGQFVDVNTGMTNLSNFSPWYPGEPNGDLKENCLEVFKSNGLWNDVGCERGRCALCNISTTPSFVMRGLCYGSRFDAHYGWTNQRSLLSNDSDKFTFRGYATTFLEYDDSSDEWRLILYDNPDIYATMNETKDGYPFGTHTWTFVNDTCKGIEEKVIQRKISFSGCLESMFNCNDGTCVDLDQRCNGIMDCLDRSDESDCEIIDFGTSYYSDIPAPPSGFENDGKRPLDFSIQVLDVLEINEVQSLMKLQVWITLKWFDTRHIYLNLKSDESLNSIKQQQKDKMWMPDIIFTNSRKIFFADFKDNYSFAAVSALKDGFPSDFDYAPYQSVSNKKVYKGMDCPINVSKVFDGEFSCQFSMAYYPFDTQRCRLLFQLRPGVDNFVRLQESRLEFVGEREMMRYTIFGVRFVPNDADYIIVEMALGRRIFNEILTTFLPTILIVLVSFSTNYFAVEHFEASISVNLTLLLVLATIFISVSNGLPRTSYLKMIDVWCLFTMSVPFEEVMVHTVIDIYRKKLDQIDEGLFKKGESHSTIQGHENKIMIGIKVARIGFPVVFIIFIVCFFSYGLSLHEDISDFRN